MRHRRKGTVLGREKAVINFVGMKIFPYEVEEVLAAHPSVAEAAVAGVPDAYRGETVWAWVVCKPGHSPGEAELRAWCRERLAPFKIPTRIEFRTELPKSSVWKILKRQLVGENK